MSLHHLVHGELVELEPSPPVRDFVARAQLVAHDPDASLCDLITLIYGDDNPLLDRSVVPGVGIATPAVTGTPEFRVLLDFISRKRILGSREARTEPAEVTGGFDVPVPVAARRLGISASAVRHAILRGTMHARKRNGQYWLREEDVASYRVTRRGPAPMTERSPSLRVRLGRTDLVDLDLRHDGRLEVLRDLGEAFEGELLDWSRAAVRAARTREGVSYFEIRPARTESEILVGSLHVRGRFGIVRKIVEPTAAENAWGATGFGGH